MACDGKRPGVNQRLPVGPLRTVVSFSYADALDRGMSHDEALEHALGCARLAKMYADAGLSLGATYDPLAPEIREEKWSPYV